MGTLTIRLDHKLEADRVRIAQLRQQSTSDVAQQMLRGSLLRERLRHLHEEWGQQARATGWLTEDDILREVS